MRHARRRRWYRPYVRPEVAFTVTLSLLLLGCALVVLIISLR